MLRGTRTQYLRRSTRLFVWVWVSLAIFVFSAPIVTSTGWQRMAWAAVILPPGIFAVLLVISTLTDTRAYRKQAELQREANQRGDGTVNLPGLYRPRAIAFAKRLFDRRKSD